MLPALFCERGPPAEILTDNDTAFRSSLFKNFLDEWGVRLWFRCAHVPSGNGIIERCHRTVKRIAARKQCAISEAVYWHNVTPKDDVSHTTAPANMIYRYRIRLKGIDGMSALAPDRRQAVFKTGDRVWIKVPHGRCTTKYKIGRVTGITSAQNVSIDEMPRHIKDLRPIIGPGPSTDCSDGSSESERIITVGEMPDTPAPSLDAANTSSSDDSSDENPVVIPLRRSTRRKRPPPDCFVCDHEIRGECSSNRRTSKRRKMCALCWQEWHCLLPESNPRPSECDKLDECNAQVDSGARMYRVLTPA